MRTGISKYHEFLLILLVLEVAFSGAVAADEAAAVYSYDVVCYRDAKSTNKGKLTFTEEGVIFECASLDAVQKWAYSELKGATMVNSRLLKLMPTEGKTHSFSPFGGQAFAPELAEFIKTKLG
jgi:hypothetical protein